MSEPKDVVCPSCHKRADEATRIDKPVRRLAARCQHFLQIHYPNFSVSWCPDCAAQHNECCLCGEPLPRQ